jgi:hypothetical protein
MPLIDSYDKLILQNESVTLPNKGIYFNGSTDYLSLAVNADFQVGSGDFTIETWVYITAYPANSGYLFWYGNDGNYWNSLYFVIFNSGIVSGGIYDASVGGNTASSAGTVPLNTWTHVAFIRSGTNLSVSINGTLTTTTGVSRTVGVPGTGPTINIGALYGPTYRTYYFGGQLSEFRFSKGIGRYTSTFTPTIVPFVADSYTKLLIHPVEMPGATTFLDSETTPKTITTAGSTVLKGCFYDTETTPKVITAVGSAAIITSKFNKTAGFFNGTTDCVLVPNSADFTPGTNFTAECFVMFSTVQKCCLFAILPATAGNYGWYVQYDLGVFKFAISYDGTNFAEASKTQTPIVNIWYHILARKNGNTLEIYIDGNIGTNYDFTGRTAYNSTYSLSIGAIYRPGASQQFTAGWIKELRISDVARATAVPTTQYTTDSNTKLLLHFDTPATAPLSPAIYFDGTGDYLTVPYSTDFSFGSGDFTLEGFCNLLTLPGTSVYYSLITQSNYNTSMSFMVTIHNDTGTQKLLFQYSTNGTTLVTSIDVVIPVVANAWGHWAITRNGNTAYAFWNGVQVGSANMTGVTLYTSTYLVTVGASTVTSVNGYNPFNGFMKEMRVSNSARYTTAFTPSQTPFVTDSNTKLLIHANENNGVVTFTDSETTPKTITTYGDTKIKYIEDYRNTVFLDSETTPKYPYPVGLAKIDFVAPFGTGAAYFNGSTSYLTSPNSSSWDMSTGNFTVDFWVRRNGTQGAFAGLYSEASDGGTGWHICFGLTGTIGTTNAVFLGTRTGGGTTARMSTTTIIPDLTWTHVAIVRNGNAGTIYYNGISVGTGDLTGLNFNSAGTGICIGRRNTDEDGSYLNGRLENIQVSKSIARYTSTFNPPSEDFYLSNILKISGVSYSSISKVSSIAKASISKVAGVA